MIVAGLGGGEGIRIVLETEEAMLLSELADQVDSVLLLGEADDPALGRLLPNAYPEDLEASEEFTRYTRESLVDGKRQAAQSVRDATAVDHPGDGVVQIELDQAQAWGWLTFLTDLRLILAERVGLDDDESDADVETRDDYLRAAYEWAGFVQGSMLEVLDPIKP
ncbi:DUF2017 domain-containing protein [Agromyces sp. SYSU K20354]|uniref:DUF2017 family protein n=1 Tax=Agromyces cavernae TaxID=2898659 RepID=UPI001E32F00F|nr:DUF2017 family protein [Agromyces cavernae]MCD2441056.1 DUF2017 domain-containing protein [Agromyces cavernae]